MAQFKTLIDYALEDVQARARSVLDLYKQAVRPIYRRLPNGLPQQVASCVLVEIDGERCLATAAHVLDLGVGLHLGAPPNLFPMNMTFETTLKTGGTGGSDHVDVAIARLDAPAIEATKNLPFVAMGDQWPDPPAGQRIYMAMGYRNSQNKAARPGDAWVTPTIWTYKGVGIETPKAAGRQGGGEFNFAIEYGKKGRREDGELVPNTPPHGVSGGPIFDLGGGAEMDLLGARPAFAPRLAGIVIEGSKTALIGTHISVLHRVIADAKTREAVETGKAVAREA